MTDNPTPDPDEDPMAQYTGLIEKYAEDIESKSRKIGLYTMTIGLAPNPHPDPFVEEQAPILVVNYTIGDLAFSDRVQNPVEGRMDTEFKILENQMTKQSFEELREKMEQAVKDGKNPLEVQDEEE